MIDKTFDKKAEMNGIDLQRLFTDFAPSVDDNKIVHVTFRFFGPVYLTHGWFFRNQAHVSKK